MKLEINETEIDIDIEIDLEDKEILDELPNDPNQTAIVDENENEFYDKEDEEDEEDNEETIVKPKKEKKQEKVSKFYNEEIYAIPFVGRSYKAPNFAMTIIGKDKNEYICKVIATNTVSKNIGDEYNVLPIAFKSSYYQYK